MNSRGGGSRRNKTSNDRNATATALKGRLADMGGNTTRSLMAAYRADKDRVEITAMRARAFVIKARKDHAQALAREEAARATLARSNAHKGLSSEVLRDLHEAQKPSPEDVVASFKFALLGEGINPDGIPMDGIWWTKAASFKMESATTAADKFVDSLISPEIEFPDQTYAIDAAVFLGYYLIRFLGEMRLMDMDIDRGDFETFFTRFGHDLTPEYTSELRAHIKVAATAHDLMIQVGADAEARRGADYTDFYGIAAIGYYLLRSMFQGITNFSLDPAAAEMNALMDYARQQGASYASIPEPASITNAIRGLLVEPIESLIKLITPYEEPKNTSEVERAAARKTLEEIDQNSLKIIQVAEAVDSMLPPGLASTGDVDLQTMCDAFILQCGAETTKRGEVVTLFGISGNLNEAGGLIATYGRVFDMAMQVRVTINDVNTSKLQAIAAGQNTNSKFFSSIDSMNKCTRAGLNPIVLSSIFKMPLSEVASRLYEFWVNAPASIDSRELSNSLDVGTLETRLLDERRGPLDPALYSNDRFDSYNLNLAAARDAIRHLPIVSYDDAASLVDLLSERVMMHVVRVDKSKDKVVEEDLESVSTEPSV